ncbi:MAG TPA: bifunctional UDP-N-acetylmuramoyl-tripeptide:D-alanyl-D-alanine ligase/alanine racemase [Bacteroidales bacterium]|nr:bifunctional UDP-N-acetylmuramoyl-tripeptide:D-alanyl-D-alanine ligase/alanine racemase [Bacteroidales bacterium]
MNTKIIANVCHGQYVGSSDVDIEVLLTDSRSLSFPERTLFFALVTNRADGHNYIEELYNRGVRAFVVNKDFAEHKASLMTDACFIAVNNTLTALQDLAAYHRNQFKIPVIGITGSNGKTCVKEWLYQLLNADHSICRSPRSYNSQIGVPLSVWQLSAKYDMAIFEAGISQRNEMKRLEPIVKPTIGILTNITDAHQENFVSQKEKCLEKAQLFSHAELVIYNKDNKLIDDVCTSLSYKTLTWGRDTTSDIVITSITNLNEPESDKQTTLLNYTYRNSKGHYTLPFSDHASVENSLHCLALMLYMGYGHSEIGLRMLNLEPVAMRMEVKEGLNGCTIINDSYNADLTSLDIALDFLKQQALLHDKSNRTLIMSDILQNGISTEDLYRQVANMLRSRQVTHFIGIGEDVQRHQQHFKGINSEFYSNTESYIAHGGWQKLNNSVVLIKGSRRYGLEKISQRLEKVVHETVLEVNLSALTENLNYFRSKLDKGTKMMCMVKAFAYGSGIVDVSRALQRHHVDYLAVAVADEGALLRREGITLPIVVMNPESNAMNTIIENNLEPNVYNINKLNEVINAVERQGLNHYPIHIKIDSGMHRLGFELQDIDNLCEVLRRQEFVEVKSTFSHLAGADSDKFDEFTREQIGRYEACAEKLQQGLPYHIIKHILNSAGIERFTEKQFDMVRLGIGLYGFSSLPDVKLKNVCSLKTVILQIKTVRAGESIGYSRNTWLTTDRKIAVIPIGYADGFDRRLGNRAGHVFVNGVKCPVMGNVCMDVAMIDVTDADAHEGDSVEIFGEHQTIEQLAEQLGTITYEILTSVSRRVKRIYFEE